ncbi:type II secretion system major pseudopilin GspG [Massilia sp. TS11]|uniref:type II secretion system major pseudopilin GspG n=1 Tax=Massilia sp. TS11 TaxID=2908003 RepID=UPI001EDB6160|nr:type II secretion system major pseudopilin GspG [Massilia sp. TS11]MCG2585856.1 type II secretion system major pseudopilin GspG [Massilia sp. TS11]
MQTFPQLRRPARGFTLVEIMVVVVIIGVLAALVLPKVLNRTGEARVTAAKTDIARIMQQLQMYKLDNLRYPSAEQGLEALVTRPANGPAAPGWKGYLDAVPKDPWGNPYRYLNPGARTEIEVISLGADGKPGGSGEDADISSADLNGSK